ncbi:MAG: hypothetical protein ACXVHS_10345 [Methanobacterium sp.]
MNTSPNIEKLFLKYIKDMGKDPGGFIGFLKPEIIEEGDPKVLGKEMQIGAALLKDGFDSMHFHPFEMDNGKAGARLKESIEIYRQMGEEIEKMTEKEPKEYHLYVIALLIDIVSSLLNHIEIHEENQE